jgi:hypothetical protein
MAIQTRIDRNITDVHGQFDRILIETLYPALSGYLIKSLTGWASPFALTESEARNNGFKFTNASAANPVVFGDYLGAPALLFVWNASGQTLTMKATSGDTGKTIDTGKGRLFYHDGTNMQYASAEFDMTTGAISLALGSDATGDTYYRNSSGVLARLPIGSAGQALTVASGLPSWATPSGGGGGWVDEITEVSITGATTLTSSAFGKMHKVEDSGTPANYNITLPTPAGGDLGKIIGIRIAPAATKLFTLDAGATRSIAGATAAQTRALYAPEYVYLKAIATSGTCWQRVGGVLIPMFCQMHMSANQSIGSSVYPPASMLAIDTVGTNVGGMANAAGNAISIRRAGNYRLSGQVYYNLVSGANTASCFIYVSGTLRLSAPETAPTTASEASAPAEFVYPCAAGDSIQIAPYHTNGSSRDAWGSPTTILTYLIAEEILAW